MSTQFYQKWWFWLIAAALIYFIFYTTYNGHDAIKSKTVSMPLETASSQQAENITVQDKVYTPEQSTPSSTNLDLKPKDDFDKIIDKIGQVITFNNGSKIKLKEAAPGELLGKREIAVYKKEKLMSCVEGIRLGEMFIDRYGTYHIIVDVSVINFSHSEFTLTNRNFTLIDNDSQYTYRPSIQSLTCSKFIR